MNRLLNIARLLLLTAGVALMGSAAAFPFAGPLLQDPQISHEPLPGSKPRQSSLLPASCLEVQDSVLWSAAKPESQATSADYVTIGKAYFRRRQFNCAAAAFQEALRHYPKFWQPSAASTDDNSRATEQLPQEAEVRNALGVCLLELGQPDDAVEAFKSALGIDPRFTSAALNLARILDKQQRYTAESYYLETALSNSRHRQGTDELKVALAAAYAHAGNYSAAIGLFQKLLRSAPDSGQLHFELANTYAQNQQYKEAAAEYQEALRRHPASMPVRLSLGKSLLMLKQYQAALPQIREYTRREPEQSEGFTLLGQVYRNLGQTDEAETALKRALKLDPANYQAAYNLGIVFEISGKLDQAVAELEEAVELNPDGPEAAYELGLALAKDNQPEASRRELQKFQKLNSQHEQIAATGDLIREGNRFLQDRFFEQAIARYREALRLDGHNALTHYNLSLALSAIGNASGEWSELQQALRIEPNLSQAHNRLGLRYSAAGHLPEAENEFKTAIAIDPRYAEAENNLGVLYGREGRHTEAVALLRNAVHDDPNYAQALVNLGLLLADGGQYQQAEKNLESALKLDPHNDSALKALNALKTAATAHENDSSRTPSRQP